MASRRRSVKPHQLLNQAPCKLVFKFEYGADVTRRVEAFDCLASSFTIGGIDADSHLFAPLGTQHSAGERHCHRIVERARTPTENVRVEAEVQVEDLAKRADEGVRVIQ